ncbi:phosphoserine phosphatase [Thiomicrospira aerophila AL3]|uniref:Phosphoserine phosphatase n=1 Tax=Thiomicrospira aerophila AL3 TaxID=717772 RepID=W0DXT8_9GAMM|nr:phosphoserine phosphatase SerB [Thiomicrospira aerophila]AHF01661.1 phosphoserine phosphatase [Thiomicrospira aerophila AL3]
MNPHTLVIHHHELTQSQLSSLRESVGEPIAHHNHWRIVSEQTLSPSKLIQLRETLALDLNYLPADFNPAAVKLVISDMDSTLISIECIDEIADMFNIKPHVAAITEAAMRGELNFEQSLTQRVALLSGLDEQALDRVYNERLTLNPGAEAWITGLKNRDIKFALVSGGFDFFTSRLTQRLGLDFSRANKLAIEQGVLTGSVVGSIVGAQAKADFLHELCQQLAITPEQVIAIGDGANDLLMMKAAGLSVAFRAKPTVQAQANCVLNYSGLDAMLDLLA